MSELRRHKKRGTYYTVVGRRRMQGLCSDDEPIVIYKGASGDFWVCSEIEFEDGRFEKIEDGVSEPGRGRRLRDAGHCIVTKEMMVVGCETLYREAADDITAIPRCDELVKAVFLAMVGASPSLVDEMELHEKIWKWTR